LTAGAAGILGSRHRIPFGATDWWRAWRAKLCLEPQQEKLVQSLRLVAYCWKDQLPRSLTAFTDPHGLQR
jgi:hypothetical protein